MASVNKVILVGNLGKDPEIRTLESGAVVANFSLATTEVYKDRNTGERKENTEWHNIVMWRGLAEIAHKYLKKGSSVYLEGRLKSRQYQTKEGETRYITEILANEMVMLGSRNNSGASAAPSGNVVAEPPQERYSAAEGDDLPF